MVDEGLFRRALSWLPSNFVAVDPAALNAPPRFSSTDHLATEAVAAYVDGELPMKAHLRAASHLSACPQCAAEVDAQTQARSALRESRPVTMPSSLMGLLSAIPQSAPSEPQAPIPPAAVPPVAETPPGSQRHKRKRR